MNLRLLQFCRFGEFPEVSFLSIHLSYLIYCVPVEYDTAKHSHRLHKFNISEAICTYNQKGEQERLWLKDSPPDFPQPGRISYL